MIIQYELNLIELHNLAHATVANGQIVEDAQRFQNKVFVVAPVFQIGDAVETNKESKIIKLNHSG